MPAEGVSASAGLSQSVEAGRDAYVAGGDLTIVYPVTGAKIVSPPALLPRDAPRFTGRKQELGRIAALAEGGSVVVSTIEGAAGVGKTALALHAAHRLLPGFPGGHLYADLRGWTDGLAPAEPGEVLEVFLLRLGVTASDLPTGVEERSGLLRQLLASRRLLMVLDNVAAEAQVRPLLPGAGSSLVLITSRIVLAGLEVDDRVRLDVLPDDEATELLVRIIGQDRTVAELGAIGRLRELCGCLPLALRIVGQILAVHPVGFQKSA